ncbi:hypothetical protein [Corynebacterium variabile]|uniref:hypothetical protein n=1 Tax=Corynebacterium variabile TaxID=1727 RepID=UPI002FE4031D
MTAQFKDETELKEALGIDTWRHLSRDKMAAFISTLPQVDTDVAMKIVEQFPSFKDFAQRAIDQLTRAHEDSLEANQTSTTQVHQAYREVRAALMAELAKDNLTWEQRRYIIEQIQQTADQQFAKDSENKRFIDTTLGKVTLGVGGVAAIVLAGLGGHALGESAGQA